MRREVLWKELAAASDAVHAAANDWTREQTPQARATVDAATRAYVNQLPRVIGPAVAQRYAHRLREYREAADRFDALRATLNAAPSVDAADAELLRQVAEEESASGRAYEAAAAAVMAALDRARAHDQELDEQGRA